MNMTMVDFVRREIADEMSRLGWVSLPDPLLTERVPGFSMLELHEVVF
jgi:hypothetical protein